MVEKLLSISNNKWVRISALALCLIILIGIIYFPNYARLKKLRDENKRLTSENEDLIMEIADYEQKLKRIGKDPYLFEKIARDELGIAKKDEIVIDIKE